MNIVETSRLGKRYGRTWALRDCTLAIPEGRVTALVGPNGAGKTTLLHLVAGLALPTSGQLEVLGGASPGSPAALDGIAFVAQDAPLYRSLSVRDSLHLARNLNRDFDLPFAESRVRELGISARMRVGRLSGGQQAQLALTVALARRPRMMMLDEPLAMLDPVARHDFMAAVMAAVAEHDVSVVLSSHVLAELEQVADHIVVLSHGRVQVAGEVDDLIADHRLLTGPTDGVAACERRLPVVHVRVGRSQAHLLVRSSGEGAAIPAGWEVHGVGLQELILGYLRQPDASMLPGPASSVPRGPAAVSR